MGLAIFHDRYVLFEGTSYADRDSTLDRVSLLPENVHIDGPSEVVFSRPNGQPDISGTYTLSSSHGDSLTLYLRANGLTE